MAAQKTMMVYAIDASKSMKNQISDTSLAARVDRDGAPLPLPLPLPSKFSIAKSLVLTHIANKLTTSSTTEFSVLAYGSEVTANYLNENQGGYNNIQEVAPMAKPTASTVSTVSSEMQVGSMEGDVVEGLIAANDILTRAQVGKKYNRVLILVTDGETAVDDDGVEVLGTVLSHMQSIENCFLCVVLIGKSTDATASRRKKENAKLYRSCVDATGGYYLEGNCLSDLYTLFSIGAGFCTRPIQSKIIMEITPKLKFPCVFFNLVMKAKAPTLAKSAVSIKRADGTSKDIDNADGTGLAAFNKVKLDRMYCNARDEEEIVPPDAQISGFKYGPQYIPFGKDEESILKIQSDSAYVRIIGFLPADKVPRHAFLSTTLVLQGSPTMESAQEALAALAKAMREKGHVCLARFVKKASDDPVLVALVPPSTGDGTLLVQRLPMNEDVRDYSFPSFPAGSDLQLEGSRKGAVSRYVNSVITAAAQLGSGSPRLSPINPAIFSVIEWFRDSLVGEHFAELAHIDQPFDNCTASPTVVAALDNLCSTFELKKVEKTPANKKAKTFFMPQSAEDLASSAASTQRASAQAFDLDASNMLSDAMTAASAGQGDRVPVAGAPESALAFSSSTSAVIQQQVEVQAGPSIADIQSTLDVARNDILAYQISTLSPKEDFRKTIRSIELAATAKQLADFSADYELSAMVTDVMNLFAQSIEYIIEKENGASASDNELAVSCIKVLKNTAISKGKCQVFNDFLKALLTSKFPNPQHLLFWDLFFRSKVAFITTFENKTSTVTEAMALELMAPKKTEVSLGK